MEEAAIQVSEGGLAGSEDDQSTSLGTQMHLKHWQTRFIKFLPKCPNIEKRKRPRPAATQKGSLSPRRGFNNLSDHRAGEADPEDHRTGTSL